MNKFPQFIKVNSKFMSNSHPLFDAKCIRFMGRLGVFVSKHSLSWINLKLVTD